MGFTRFLNNITTKFNLFLQWVLTNHAKFTYKYPVIVLILSLTLLGCLGYGFTMYEVEYNDGELWIPEDSRSLKDVEKIKDVYGTGMNLIEVYVTAKEEGSNLLTTEAFEELIEYELGFWNTVSNEDVFYNDLCIRTDNAAVENESFCYTQNYPLLFFLKSDASFEYPSNVLQRINSGKGTSDFFPAGSSYYIPINKMFSGVLPDPLTIADDGTNNIVSAEAIRWESYISSNKYSFNFNKDFEENLDDYSKEFSGNSKYIEVRTLTRTTIAREQQEVYQEDLKYIYIGISLIILYSFYVLGSLNTYRSRMFIVVIGLLSVGIAYIEAISLGAYLGIKGNSLVSLVPFLLLGIGVDDMFVLIASLNQAPSDSSGEEKIKFMMKNAGVSITITSFTNVAAFAIGSVTSIPAIRNYCIYTAFGMLFDYLNQISFFLSILSLDIRRSERSIGDCCGLVFCKPESCCKGKYIFTEEGSLRAPLSEKLFRGHIGPFLMKTPVKIAAIVVFSALAAMNIYATTQLKIEFSYEWLAWGTHSETTLEIRDEYFEEIGRTLRFYSLEANLSTTENQQKLQSLTSDIENCEGCEEQWTTEGSTDSWYSFFREWVETGNCEVGGRTVALENGYIPSEDFNECLKIWEKGEGFLYDAILEWNEEKTELIASAITCSMYTLKNSAEKIQFLDDVRDLAKVGPGDSFPFNGIIPRYEHDKVFQYETTLQLTSVMLMVLVAMIFTNADLVAGFLISSMVGLTIIGQLGYLFLWGDYQNLVTIVNTVVAVGISVDYCAHFMHAFKTAKGETRNERVIETFGSVGTSVFNGGFSTFLAIISLSLSENYLFEIFFKCWFALFIYGMGHALILLPVLLSFFGPPPFANDDQVGLEKNDSNLDQVELKH